MNETITIPKENHLYHLSYDIISKVKDKEDKPKEHIKLKKDIVWEILVALPNGSGEIRSDVSSTIIFESSEDMIYWFKKLGKLSKRMHFVLSEIFPFFTDDKEKSFEILLNPNSELSDNFQSEVVDKVVLEYRLIKKSGRVPNSKLIDFGYSQAKKD